MRSSALIGIDAAVCSPQITITSSAPQIRRRTFSSQSPVIVWASDRAEISKPEACLKDCS